MPTLQCMATAFSVAASRLADLLEDKTQVPEIAYNVVLDEATRFDANVDSGTSVSASGRRCLFPTELITQWHPETSVRSASQQRMDVLFVGTMILHTGCGRKIYIADSMCVPEMGDLTLISPKQLFHGSGIRTEFNDIRRLTLPSGEIIKFTETNKSYILKIRPLDAKLLRSQKVLALAPAPPVLPSVAPDLVHRRMCHFSPDRISASLHLVKGLCNVPRHFCLPCVRGGMKAPPIHPPGKSTTDWPAKPKSQAFGDLVWSDVCTLPISEPFGFIGWCVFLDDATRLMAVYCIRSHTQEEMLRALQSYLTHHAEYLPKVDGKPTIKCYGTDNHGEYFSKSSDEFFKELFIRHKSMPSYSPWRNPSERSHGVVLRCIRIVHADSTAPLKLWPFTAAQAVRVHNGLVTRSKRVILENASPFFMVTGKQQDFSRIKVMFCRMICFVHDPNESHTKLDVPTVDAIHLGMDDRRNGYLAFVPQWKRYTTFPLDNCKFFEDDYPDFNGELGDHTDLTELLGSRPLTQLTDRAGNRKKGTGRKAAVTPAEADRAAQKAIDAGNRAVAAAAAAMRAPAPAVPRAPVQAVPVAAGPAVPATPAVAAAPPVPAAAVSPVAQTAQSLITGNDAFFVSLNNEYDTVIGSIGDDFLCLNLDSVGALPAPPRKSKEFNSRPDGELWWSAAQTEYEAKNANETYELVERPRGNVVKSRVVCGYKYDSITGALKDEGGFYVRWVACGYSEVHGKDYWNTYTATTKAPGLRVFAAFVAAYNLDTCLIDDIKFFTQTPLKDVIHCEQMDGFEEGGHLPDGRTKLVCRLKKGLEGLKQSGNNAQVQCVEHLVGPCQLTQLDSEPTIFTRTFTINGTRVFFIMLVWIDDKWAGFSRGGYEAILVPFLKVYNRRFKSTNTMGDAKRFIGIDLIRDRDARKISLSQEKYISTFVPKFVDDVKSKLMLKTHASPAVASRPDPYHNLYDLSLNKTEVDRVDEPYLAAVASAMYAACMTRGDVAYHTAFLSQFSKLPFQEAWDALVRLLVCLYATRKHALTYGGKEIKIPDAPTCKPKLNPSTIEQMYGLIIFSDASWKLNCTYAGFFILFCNGAVDWGSNKLKVMLSSTEAEIAAGSNATRRIVYIRNLIGEIFELPQLPISHIVDNSATPHLTEKMGSSRKTEHFRRWLQFMRYAVLHNFSFVHLCSTHDQLADGLTKVTYMPQWLAMHNIMLNL
jgi:hypothetical protein